MTGYRKGGMTSDRGCSASLAVDSTVCFSKQSSKGSTLSTLLDAILTSKGLTLLEKTTLTTLVLTIIEEYEKAGEHPSKRKRMFGSTSTQRRGVTNTE